MRTIHRTTICIAAARWSHGSAWRVMVRSMWRCLFALAAMTGVASAQGRDDEPAQVVPAEPRLAAGTGLALIDAVPVGAGAIAVTTSYDGARHGIGGAAGGEVLVWRGLYAVGGALGAAGATWRPYAGAKLALARDASVSVVYKAEGFAEPEGEIEVRVAGGHRFGSLYALGNAIYGQDFDAKDRDAECAAALLYEVGPRLVVSSQSRVRFALASQRELMGSWDVVSDLGAALPWDRFAVRAAGGVVAIGGTRVAVGPVATLAVTAVF
jgi:hypothetical protein